MQSVTSLNEFDTLGFYEPGFLHLRINTENDVHDLNNLLKENPELFSTFLHEYIHFLQDISSTYGLFSAGFYVDFIKDINWEIRHDGKAEFYVPVRPTNVNNVLANLTLREIYRGRSEGSSFIKYDGYTEDILTVKDKAGNEVYPVKYTVHYYDLLSKEKKKIHFGYACLKEYVAHAVQSKFNPKTDHPDIPYQIAALIVEKEYPDFGDDSMLIAALCDASIMSLHPAQMFFKTIARMKESGFVPSKTKDVYEFAFDNLRFQGQGRTEDVISLFKGVHSYTDGQFTDALKSEIFAANQVWISHVLAEAVKLRLERIDFITSLVNDTFQLSATFFEIIKKLGTPFFTNKNDVGGFIPPDTLNNVQIQPYQLLVFKQILQTFAGEKRCGLYDFCKKRPDKDITNNYCLTSPWLKSKETELCPFGQIWKTWGLINEIPVPR